jgi:hypothetical protein
VRQALRELGGRRQEDGHLLFEQTMLLHRCGKHDLRELVSPLSLLKTPKSQENIEFSAPQS